MDSDPLAEFWRNALRAKESPTPLNPRAAQAFELCKTLTLREAGGVLGVGPERTRNLRDQHSREAAKEAARLLELEGFLSGAVPFEKVRVCILGTMSVRLSNTLYRLGVRTLAALLRLTVRDLLYERHCGRKQVREINALLAYYGAPSLTLR